MDLRDDDARFIGENLPQPVRVLALAHVVKLAAQCPGELVGERLEVVTPSQAFHLSGATGKIRKNCQIRGDGLGNSGFPYLDDDLRPVEQCG